MNIIRIHLRPFKGAIKARITPYKRLYEVGGTFKIYKCVIMHPHCRAGRVTSPAAPPQPPQSRASSLMLYLIFSKAPSLIMRRLRLKVALTRRGRATCDARMCKISEALPTLALYFSLNSNYLLETLNLHKLPLLA